MRTARLAGHYLNVLGVSTVLGLIVDPIFGLPVHIDLVGLFICFWAGMGLLNGRPGFRSGVMILTSLFVLVCVGRIIYAAVSPGPVSGPGPRSELQTPLLSAVHSGVGLALLLPLLILILAPGTKRWLAESRMAPPPRYAMTGKVVGLYVVGAAFLCAVTVFLYQWPETARPNEHATTFEYGDRKLGIVSVRWLEDKQGGRPLFVGFMAFAEADSVRLGHEGVITFGSHAVEVPPVNPVRYIVNPPTDDASRGNVLIVRQDGTVNWLPRRVRPNQVEEARDVVRGVRDFDELQRRLEALLPAADVAAR